MSRLFSFNESYESATAADTIDKCLWLKAITSRFLIKRPPQMTNRFCMVPTFGPPMRPSRS